MKKLLDESTDELTRSLLQAGRSQRPPTASRARLLVALGAAGGVGLFSSKAFAWLGTSAGKLTLLGVGVAVAGGAYSLASAPVAEPPGVAVLSSTGVPNTVLPNTAPPVPAALGASATTSAARPALDSVAESAVAEGAVAEVAVPQPASPQLAAPSAAPLPSSVPASVADAPVIPRVAPSGLGGAAARRRVAPAPSASAARTSKVSSGAAARRDDALERTEPQQDGTLSAVLEPPAGRTLPAGGADKALSANDLQSEIQLVDAMRGAAQHHDAEALRHLLDRYRGSFPEGQLKREVSELALRTLPAAQ